MKDYKELFEQKGKYIFRTRYNIKYRHTMRLNTENFNVDIFINGIKIKSNKFLTLDEAYNFFRR